MVEERQAREETRRHTQELQMHLTEAERTVQATIKYESSLWALYVQYVFAHLWLL
jgi:hypothetical protein